MPLHILHICMEDVNFFMQNVGATLQDVKINFVNQLNNVFK